MILKHIPTLKKKLIINFIVILVMLSVLAVAASALIFKRIYNIKSGQFIQDITRQTTTNMKENIQKVENITFELLKNTVIQNLLVTVNENTLTDYELINIRKQILNELGTQALYNNDSVSMSIGSLSGEEFIIEAVLYGGEKDKFTKEEIFLAKGSTLWGVTEDGENNICIARAIISMKTQKPIGYINIIMKESYFGDIIKDISGTYASGAYVIDKDHIVISSNRKEILGEIFPVPSESIPEQGRSIEKINGSNSYLYASGPMSNGWRLIVTVPLNEVEKDMVTFLIMVIAIVLGAAILAAWAMVGLVTRSIEPLERLKESMNRVGQGDFSSRVPIVADDEIGQLGKTYNHMAANIENLIEKAYKMEISQKEAEIEFLKMQINPHFLYNTLDTISWMARMQHNQDIAEVAMALGDLLRSNLKQESMITIGEELKSVRNYVFIQEYRFGDKISVGYEIDRRVRNYLIPNFILQPLVENSIIHGLEPKLGKGTLLVQIFIHQEELYFRIVDDGIGMNQEQIKGIYLACEQENSKRCIGLKNVYRRLKIYYGEEGTLRIASEVGEGSRICFSIPIDKLKQEKQT